MLFLIESLGKFCGNFTVDFSLNFKFELWQPEIINCHLFGDFCLVDFKIET
jgi:hypothetical protein